MFLRGITRIKQTLQNRYVINFGRQRQKFSRYKHKRYLPALNGFDQAIVRDIQKDGAAITSLSALYDSKMGLSFDMKAACDILATPKNIMQSPKNYFAEASLEQLSSAPQLIMWGLEERFLSIAEKYIGLPIAYRGLVLRKDFADGKSLETRQWHRDAEDVRILKIIVYINDVSDTGGPFRFLPHCFSPNEKRIKYVDDRVSETHMEELVSADRFRKCIGLSGTVIFVDTARVWHHGCIPTGNDRLTAFYAYNSQNPLRPQYCQPLFPRHSIAESTLTNTQNDSITYHY